MDVIRILRHLLIPPWHVQRAFPKRVLRAIEAAISRSERRHAGEIRFAVETALDPLPLWRGVSARERALEVFSRLRVWDTAQNNGVLIYLLLADHDVEIVADRGVADRVAPAEWERICREIEADFRAGAFEAGAIAGIAAVGALLARHFPSAGGVNELPDRPSVR